MKFLVTSDTHFSSKPRDRYRFGLFPWLIEQQDKYNVDATFIAGDICEEKDRHPASLVNDLVNLFSLLKPPVYILKGNHDFIDVDMPFFQFLNHIPGVKFVVRNHYLTNEKVVLIPHQANQTDMDLSCEGLSEGWGVILHNTFDGAIAETGQRMGGLKPPASLYNARWCVSGDIHRPQQVGPVLYCGAPYQVRFGDNYEPRVMLIDDGKEFDWTDLHFPAPRKLHLHVCDANELVSGNPGDQVKVTLELLKEEVVDWAKHKEAVLSVCREKQLEVHGLELKVLSQARERIKNKQPTAKSIIDHFEAFCLAEQTPSQVKQVGNQLMEGKNGS